MKFEIKKNEIVLKPTIKIDKSGDLLFSLNTIDIAYICHSSGRLIRLRQQENIRDILKTLGISIDDNGKIETL